MDLLMNYHSLDIEWGNHDILWMGASAGSEACIATVIRNNLKYHNIRILENSYGISLRDLTLFAEKLYPDTEPMENIKGHFCPFIQIGRAGDSSKPGLSDD